jgi:hypothetical protein
MDAPFRLAALATHPPKWGWARKHGCPLPSRCARHPPPKWGWARKTWRRGAINPKPCLPLLAGGGGPRLYLKSCLPPCSRWQGTTFPKPCLPPLAGGGGPRSQNLASPRSRGEGDRVPKTLPPPARGGRGTTKWWKGVAAPSGRCLRSGHKNSVKGKGAIKHKGAGESDYSSCGKTACGFLSDADIESAFLRILMHCCVMGLDMNESSLA